MFSGHDNVVPPSYPSLWTDLKAESRPTFRAVSPPSRKRSLFPIGFVAPGRGMIAHARHSKDADIEAVAFRAGKNVACQRTQSTIAPYQLLVIGYSLLRGVRTEQETQLEIHVYAIKLHPLSTTSPHMADSGQNSLEWLMQPIFSPHIISI